MEADLALLELAPADCMLEDCQGQRRRGRWRQLHAALSVYTYTIIQQEGWFNFVDASTDEVDRVA